MCAASCLGCAIIKPAPPTLTPDYAALETEVARKLGATMTSKAPTSTHTPTHTSMPPTATPRPSPTATPTATLTPSPDHAVSWLAYAFRRQDDRVDNIMVSDLVTDQETILTRFVEPLNMSDIDWSWDGAWLVFVSTHDFVHSQGNERNVFMVRPDGTDLQMVTGSYLDPEAAPGPYAVLSGQVISGTGECLVCAQGASSAVIADEDGQFELPGVPLTAKWVRAVCQDEDTILQGEIDLLSNGEAFAEPRLVVHPHGQGWRQAAMSRDGNTLAGTYYRWELDTQGERQYQLEGVLYDLDSGNRRTLALPPETTLMGLAWSPIDDELVGGISGEEGTWLWRWDAEGRSLGPLIEIPNPEQEMLSVANPAWSPDGAYLAFELRHWYWWGENTYRTDLMIASRQELDPQVLVESEWGQDAQHPSWGAQGKRVFYQLSTGEPNDDHQSKDNGSIWVVAVAAPTPIPVLDDGQSYYPAARPPLP